MEATSIIATHCSPLFIVVCLVGAAAAAVLSIVFFIRHQAVSRDTLQTFPAIWLLALSAFLIRLLVAAIDPYLNEWDERFHAAVAKNLIDNPWMPVLRQTMVEPFNFQLWWSNHVWMHKPPLFLWQMALFIKIFGANEIGLRLSSVLMSSIAVVLTFRMVRLWTRDDLAAFIAALLTAFNYFWIELASGTQGLDHNDLAFTFYVTASVWTFCEYCTERRLHWIVLTGLFTGFAILCKWLPGLLVFSGWGVLWMSERFDKQRFFDLLIALCVTVVVALPWQLYILHRFPVETLFEWNSMHLHFNRVLDEQGGTLWYHFERIAFLYGPWIGWLIPAGIVCAALTKTMNRKLTIALLSMLTVVYVFYSVASTKMTSFTFIAAAIVFGLIALPLSWIHAKLKNRNRTVASVVVTGLVVTATALSFRPWEMISYRSPENTARNIRIHNTDIYKSLPDSVVSDYIIFNCKGMEELDLMFYRGGMAYRWNSSEHRIDSLLKQGVKIAAFKSYYEHELPDYMLRPEILILDYDLK